MVYQMVYLPYLHHIPFNHDLENANRIENYPLELFTHYYVFAFPFLQEKYLLFHGNDLFLHSRYAIPEINQKIIKSIEIENKHNYSFESVSLIWLISSKALFIEGSHQISSATSFQIYKQHADYFKTKHIFIRYMVLIDNVKNQRKHFFSVIKTHQTTKLLKHFFLEKISDINEIYRILLSLINKKIRKQESPYFPIWLTSSNNREETIDMGTTIEGLLQYQPCEIKRRLETGDWFQKDYPFDYTIESVNYLPLKTTTSIDRYLSDLEIE